MSVIRAFIALDFSQGIYKKLSDISSLLQERLLGMPIRWVKTDNIHLTIKFLGDVPTSNLEFLGNILQTETKKIPPFEIEIGELGAYPNVNRPRVIWIGAKIPQELLEFYQCIEHEITQLGYSPEKRNFSPHLTLGRVSRKAGSNEAAKIGQVISDYKVGLLGIDRIENVHLYRSDLKPTGAVYTRLYSASFGNPEINS